ncbi:hypothetical protein [Streptomyces sp. NBC_00457]|uniref:hypothetical protein n=1 Tax=Streptomyces sp. NBC_00457 TaxID=2975748 RepID=UPI003FCE28A7
MCFRGTLQSILLLALWIGFSWLLRGTMVTATAASAPDTPSRGWMLFTGIIGMLAGIVLIVSLREPLPSGGLCSALNRTPSTDRGAGSGAPLVRRPPYRAPAARSIARLPQRTNAPPTGTARRRRHAVGRRQLFLCPPGGRRPA